VTDASSLPRVLVVCRGSSEHGLGHVMRARTVASSLARRLPVQVVALGDSEILTPLLRGRSFPFRVEADAQSPLKLASEWQPRVVVYDATEFPIDTFLEIRKRAMTVSLSPVFNCQEHVHLLFHRTRCLTDQLTAIEKKVAIRRGLDYVVLRESCHRIPEETFTRSLDRGPLAVAISMGGVDASNKTLEILSSLRQLASPLLLWVLLGEGYAHSYQALVDCVSQDTRHEIILAKTTDSLWRVMETCSIAILAGGITTYEAAYAGLPSINLLHNSQGPALVQELVERGVGLSAGPPFSATLAFVSAELARLEASRAELLAMHRRSHGLIDDRGAERIAAEIEAYYWNEYIPSRNKACEAEQPRAA
jgi:spore coat polysaccharide biosynthesis predicted glycosyltransferase SpsG